MQLASFVVCYAEERRGGAAFETLVLFCSLLFSFLFSVCLYVSRVLSTALVLQVGVWHSVRSHSSHSTAVINSFKSGARLKTEKKVWLIRRTKILFSPPLDANLNTFGRRLGM